MLASMRLGAYCTWVAAVNERGSAAADAGITRVLRPGEALLWAGRRRQRFALKGLSVVVLFLWLGVLLTFVATRETGALVLLAVVAIVVSAALAQAVARDAAYGLSNQRAVIVRGRFRPQVRSIPLQWLTDFQLTERPDGVGTIGLDPSRRWTPPRRAAPAFEDIVDARRVHALIQRAQNKLLDV